MHGPAAEGREGAGTRARGGAFSASREGALPCCSASCGRRSWHSGSRAARSPASLQLAGYLVTDHPPSRPGGMAWQPCHQLLAALPGGCPHPDSSSLPVCRLASLALPLTILLDCPTRVPETVLGKITWPFRQKSGSDGRKQNRLQQQRILCHVKPIEQPSMNQA